MLIAKVTAGYVLSPATVASRKSTRSSNTAGLAHHSRSFDVADMHALSITNHGMWVQLWLLLYELTFREKSPAFPYLLISKSTFEYDPEES
jgi:hypothetical protein